MIASTLGGMIGSSVAPERSVPMVRRRLQPRSIIVGYTNCPSIAIEAMAEPEIAPRNAESTIAMR